jgi:hypothetical protein
MKKLKTWLSIAALTLGLRKRNEADDQRAIYKQFDVMSKKNRKDFQEYLTDQYKHGTNSERMLYEFALISNKRLKNEKLLRSPFVSKKRKRQLEEENSSMLCRMHEISESYLPQVEVDEILYK